MTKIEFELEMPSVPNFIMIKDGVARPRNAERPKVSIKDLSEEQLESIARDWRDKLFAHANRPSDA